MKKFYSGTALALLVITFFTAKAQTPTNIKFTDGISQQIMLGNFNPATYKPGTVLNHPDTIAQGINKGVSPDSLKAYIIQMASYYNRNTGSDTVSQTRGIGACRRWIHSKFQEFSAASNNRLIVSYLQFNQSICGMNQHRNVCAILPGLDTTDKSVIIVEGHFDSRCETSCDINCNAQGVEDNATGAALVMELARVMSKYAFNNTILFMPVMGEEQGLYGGNAMAVHSKTTGIKVKAVFNNDVIGGIICGKTSSAPSCPYENHIDSTQVRIFSYGATNSQWKQLARFSKLEYTEELKSIVKVPMIISIMAPEDRTGRGGDHIPFRQQGFASIRFTSANEHGNAGSTTPGYTDRQHTTRDTLGVDTNSDMVIDSFFVDFNYLARNTVINGNAMAMAAIGPKQPDLSASYVGNNRIKVDITQQTQYKQYRVGVRINSNVHDWDSVYTMTNTLSDTIAVTPSAVYFVSVASVDSNGVESLFSREVIMNLAGISEDGKVNEDLVLLQNRPNPFDDATWLSVAVNKPVNYKESYIRIVDVTGKEVAKLPIRLNVGINDILFEHGLPVAGTYLYSLVIDGKVIDTKSLVFAN